ncbi:MAG: hypothetical protein J0H02_05675 [Armatimonadetes bacterium]|nr:hypothetical protein [Armatimonadota bacterium]
MSSLDALKSRLYDLNALGSAVAIMDWDQQTYMPRGGADARGEHVGRLSRMHHELLTADETRNLLEKAKTEATPESDDAALLRVVGRELDLATKFPSSLVEEKSKLSALAHEEWVKARATNDFKSFAPILERMFEIAKQEADFLGYTDHVYDALLDQYEEGSNTADAQAMYDAIRGPQVELVKQIQELPETDDSWLYGDWDILAQSRFTEEIVQAIGFDLFGFCHLRISPRGGARHVRTGFPKSLGSHSAGRGRFLWPS